MTDHLRFAEPATPCRRFLMGLYPQPINHQPSVEYLPIPRLKGPAHKS